MILRRFIASLVGTCALVASLAFPQHPALAAAPGPVAAQAGPPAGQPLTLDAALQEALARNPQVTAAQQAVVAAQQNIIVARAGIAPTVNANGQGAYGTSSSTAFTSSGTPAPLQNVTGTGSVSISGNLPLYDSGKTQAAVSAAEAALASAQAALRQTTQDTALSVATAYFNVLQAERLTTVRQALLASAQAQLALTQARARAGAAAQSDVIQVQAQVAQAQVDLLSAQSQIGTSKAALLAAIGVDAITPVEVEAPAAPPLTVPISAGAAMQSAATNRPEVIKAQAAVASGQAALDQARIAAGPQVSVGVGATYVPVSTSSLLSNSLSYGLTGTVSLPLFDAGKGQAEIASSQASLHAAQAQLDAAVLTVRQGAYQAYLTAVQDAAQVTATQAAQAAADEALRVAEGRYRAGVGTIVEVITARAQAAQAEVNAANAVFNYQAALVTLQHAQGLPIQASVVGGRP
jgi:outer membrane protein